MLLHLAAHAGTCAALATALAASSQLPVMLLLGHADRDSLVRKRARQSLSDMLLPLQPADDTSVVDGDADASEAEAQESNAWQHWLALYDSLDTYSLQLIQSTWQVHLPPLVAALQESGRAGVGASLSLRWCLKAEATDVMTAETGTPAGGNQPMSLEARAKSTGCLSWMCVLAQRMFKHGNPPVRRFLAQRLLYAMQSRAGRAPPLVPMRWVASHLPKLLSDAEITPAAFTTLVAVRLLAEICCLRPCQESAYALVFVCGQCCSVAVVPAVLIV